MAGSQISTSVTIINSLLGFQAISLTNLHDTTATAIAEGSKVEIASAFFTFGSDETPQASTWTAIATGETAYITLTPSGTAGSQVVTAKWSATDPEWSDSKQGWYLTAGSTIRYVAGCTKGATAASYLSKFVMGVPYRSAIGVDRYQENPGGFPTRASTESLRTITVEIGEWNMLSTVSVILSDIEPAIGGDWAKVRDASVIIFTDTGNFYPFYYGAITFNSSGADLTLSTAGGNDNFVSPTFDGTASTVANRGFVTLTYEA